MSLTQNILLISLHCLREKSHELKSKKESWMSWVLNNKKKENLIKRKHLKNKWINRLATTSGNYPSQHNWLWLLHMSHKYCSWEEMKQKKLLKKFRGVLFPTSRKKKFHCVSLCWPSGKWRNKGNWTLNFFFKGEITMWIGKDWWALKCKGAWLCWNFKHKSAAVQQNEGF